MVIYYSQECKVISSEVVIFPGQDSAKPKPGNVFIPVTSCHPKREGTTLLVEVCLGHLPKRWDVASGQRLQNEVGNTPWAAVRTE